MLVIIPAYNEQECIKKVLAEVKASDFECDYIVVNDCSKDNTKQILTEGNYNHINLPVNLGIGGGMQTGYKYARDHGYDIAVQMDGDGQHDPKYLAALCEPIICGKADMCVGSRFIEKSGFQTSFMRRVGINFLRVLIKIFCGYRATDATSGLRACCKSLIAYYSENYAQDYPEPEAIVSAVSAGFRVTETPVEMRERAGGVSSIGGFKSVYYMFKVSIAIILRRFTAKKEK